MLELQIPHESHQEMYENMILEWSQEDDFQDTSPGALFEGENFQEFLKLTKQTFIGENNRRTQSSLFFLLEDDKIIGGIDIRHNLENSFLRDFGGHIGYGIRPSERRKGYATKMLKLALKEARILGIKKLLVCCYDGNIGSEKTITHNEGIFEKQILKDNKKLNKYWITL